MRREPKLDDVHALRDPLREPSKKQPPTPIVATNVVVNMLCLSLSLGGAERIVADLFWCYNRFAKKGIPLKANLFVLARSKQQYGIPADRAEIKICRLFEIPQEQRLAHVALQTLASGNSLLYTHLVPQFALEELWARGIMTAPVIHNLSERWNNNPASFQVDHVPGVIAVCGAVAKELKQKGCSVPIHVVTHELPRMARPPMPPNKRAERRRHFGIDEHTVLIGMVGKFKAQKRYRAAVGVLAEVRRSLDAKLMIVGSWKASARESNREYESVLEEARRLGVEDHLICTGGTRKMALYYQLFDVFLNTSEYEGLSIATLEARSYGLPIVLSAVGGQAERTTDRDFLVPEEADRETYAAAIRAAVQLGRKPIREEKRSQLVPRLWSWLASCGLQRDLHTGSRAVLFLTNNLNQGGAQRSLANLLREIRPDGPIYLCVRGGASCEQHVQEIAKGTATVFSMQDAETVWDCMDRLLAFIDSARITTLCFWNVEFQTKLLLAKLFQYRALRLIDVSPGPQMFEDLRARKVFAKRLQFDGKDYFQRLDRFVAKYPEGGIPFEFGDWREKTTVIRNGIATVSPRPKKAQVRPREVSPSHAVVTCGRIVPNKMTDKILHVAAALRKLDPRISITVVGKADEDNSAYWNLVMDLYRTLDLAGTVFFVGENADTLSFLDEFKVFFLLAKMQGCPNSSLEAMMSGLPVVANPDGGTAEQIEDAVTGFLVDENDLDGIAAKVKWLLDHPVEARQMGERGREKALREFSMERMTKLYRELLWPSDFGLNHKSNAHGNRSGIADTFAVETPRLG